MTEKPTYEELEQKIQELEKAESERKRAEDELQMSEEKFRVLFKKSIHGILIVDIETRRFPYANPAFCRMFGYSETEMHKIGVEDIHPKDELDHILSVFNRQKQGKKAGATELPCIHKDGTIFNADIAATNIVINHRKCVVGFFIDITERKRAEEALRESEERYRSIFENAVEGLFQSTPEGRFISVNPSFARMLGYASPEELVSSISDIAKQYYVNNEDRQRYKQLLQIAGVVENFEFKAKCRDGSHIWVSNSTRVIYDQDGNIARYEGYVTDITARKRAEEENTRLEAHYRQAQKMESIGTLAGGIAHDFNNILFPIVGYSEMLLEDIPEDSPYRDSLKNIYTSALRAKSLVKQILTFSRQESGELMLIKMQPIVKEALKLIRSTIPTTIEIQQDISPDCGVIKADPTQIHQIVMNLTTNAYHAMEETGGELKVSLKGVELGALDLITPDMAPGVYACLTVADTGVGMDKNLTDKIFDPFFTTKAISKGTGMGLSLVHGIVTAMGGAIQVYSEPGKGTEFHVYLPVEKSLSEKQVTNSKTQIQGGSEHILIVDDEEAILTMEKRMLEQLGYKVTKRFSSLEALEAFRDSPDKFDLVITDMAMPNMPGDKLSVELTKLRPGIPILLCTGFSETMSEEKAVSKGIKGFLLKPIVMMDLAQKIREILDEN